MAFLGLICRFSRPVCTGLLIIKRVSGAPHSRMPAPETLDPGFLLRDAKQQVIFLGPFGCVQSSILIISQCCYERMECLSCLSAVLELFSPSVKPFSFRKAGTSDYTSTRLHLHFQILASGLQTVGQCSGSLGIALVLSVCTHGPAPHKKGVWCGT